MVSEIAFACVLLVGAGLLVRSFLRVLDVNIWVSAGTRRHRPRGSRDALSPRKRKQNAYFDEVLRRVRASPGRCGRWTDRCSALRPQSKLGRAAPKGRSTHAENSRSAFVRVVSDGYLQRHGHPAARRPRYLASSDTPATEPVIVINETMARTLWPGQRRAWARSCAHAATGGSWA